MCTVNCVLFGAVHLQRDEIRGKSVLEIGSCDVNGSLRRILESYGPAEYVGVDIQEGPGVDVICDAADVLDRFGPERFDVVVSTEMIEHARDWRKVVSGMKNVCRKNGVILVTTRSFGFGYHSHPHDFWRYEVEDLANIFSDCEPVALERDTREPGAFIKVKKPEEFVEADLADYRLYSIVRDRRMAGIGVDDAGGLFHACTVLASRMKYVLYGIGDVIGSLPAGRRRSRRDD